MKVISKLVSLTKHRTLAFIVISAGLLGCASTGTISEPLAPLSVPSKSDRSVAKVYFYRSSDGFGVLRTNMMTLARVDGGDNGDGLHADRYSFMVKKLNPGTHTFTMVASERIVRLDAGRSYFLAIAWNFGGIPSLEFRDEKSFKEDTQGAEQIRVVECTVWDCEYANLVQ
jgi:hypothetical protein